MEYLISVITLMLVGPMVGVELSVAIALNPVLDRMPDAGGAPVRSATAQVLGRIMPFWCIGSLAATVLWLTTAWGGAGSWLPGVSAFLLVISVLMSVVLLVPINKRVAGWSAGPVPADWKEQLRRWDHLHYVRVAIIVAAYGLLVWAACGSVP